MISWKASVQGGLGEAKNQAGNIWVKDKITKKKARENHSGILKIYTFCREISKRASGLGESIALYMKYIQKVAASLPTLRKVAATLHSGSSNGAVGA